MVPSRRGEGNHSVRLRFATVRLNKITRVVFASPERKWKAYPPQPSDVERILLGMSVLHFEREPLHLIAKVNSPKREDPGGVLGF